MSYYVLFDNKLSTSKKKWENYNPAHKIIEMFGKSKMNLNYYISWGRLRQGLIQKDKGNVDGEKSAQISIVAKKILAHR